MVETVEPFKLHPTSFILYIWCLSIFWQMDAHSHHYHHNPFLRLKRVGWNPRWCKSTNNVTTLWLRLYSLSNCILLHSVTFISWLSTFSCGRWAYGWRLTPLSPQAIYQTGFPDWRQLAETHLGDVSVPTMPLHGWGCKTLQAASHISIIICKCLSTFSCGGWAYGCTLTQLISSHTYFPDLQELAETMGDVSVPTMPLQYGWGCIEPFKLHLHPTWICYI